MHRRFIRLFSYLLGLVLLFVVQQYIVPNIGQLKQSQKVTPAPGYYRVISDVDGDTIKVDMSGKTETIRFIGVDTPETHKPHTPVQCFGPDAAAYTKSKVEGRTVRLLADPKDDNRDRYGRLLRYIYLEDNSLLNKTLIQKGYGFAYISFPFEQKADFIKAQLTAISGKLGLWTKCQTLENGGRWQTNSL